MLRPVTKERVSPEEFQTLATKSFDRIARSRFIPPQIGDGTFGSFEVEYITPVLKEVKDNKDFASYVRD